MDDLDFTTKNVVQELLRECRNRSILISEEFIIYYVELLMLNPSWGIVSGSLPNRNDVQVFVKNCLERLGKQSHSCIVTLKMQLFFSENFENLQNHIVKHRTHLKARLQLLETEIIETKTEDEVEIEKLFRKIVYLITLYSGLGNPTNEKVYKEASAALKSVFLETDLREFMADARIKKESQLVELTELVTGIRLFNRDSQKGGAGIEDLPKLLPHAIQVTLQDVKKTLESIMASVNLLTTAIDNSYKIEKKGEIYHLRLHLPDDVDPHDFSHAVNLLIIYRQFELFVRKILVELNHINRVTEQTNQKLQDALLKVHNTVRYRIAIPTIQVFPLFSKVANIWCLLQDLTMTLSKLNQIQLSLHLEVKEAVFHTDVINLILGSSQIMTDADRLGKTIGSKIRVDYTRSEIAIVYPALIPTFNTLKLEYLGFCAWKFIETRGALIPADPNMGVVSLAGKYYAFSCPEAATAFLDDPSRNILRGLEIVRQRCELINLFDMKGQLINIVKIEKLVAEIPQVTLTFDAEVQTELHPIPTHIDPNYKWNVWDLKRQAVLYANLSRCVTHSTQTYKSQARGTVAVQTQDKKDVLQQTKKDNYSNVPTLSTFIYGLRGRLDDVQHVITLTRPIDEK